MSFLDTKIEFLKGVGPKKAILLKQELLITSFHDLLTFFPFRYIDRSKFYTINQIKGFDTDIQLIGIVKNKKELGFGSKKRLVVSFSDFSGTVDLVFFKRIHWLNKFISVGKKYLIFGKPTQYGSSISFVHPEMDLFTETKKKPHYSLYPVYHSSDKLNSIGLNSKGISRLVQELLLLVKHKLTENLSLEIINKHCFMSREKSLFEIHFPSSVNNLNQAIHRLKFEELFFLQISLLKQKMLRHKKSKSFIFKKVGDKFNAFFYNHLKFELTNAQKKVIKEIRYDVLTGFQMNRLIQGDVGSGKTVVAIMSMLLANDNGFQTCLMAPTEILASQHYETIQSFASDLQLRVVLLTGKTQSKKKKQILNDLSDNLIDIVVGTHALIQDSVFFSKLGLVVIDEQHKFGVSQRAKLWKHQHILPHVLVMTATPIPRTLAMTAYGDLDVSIIDELPPNRKKVNTIHKYDKQIDDVYQLIYKQLKNNRQAYIVYPLIEESQVLDYKNLLSGYANAKKIFEKLGFKISMVHGKMKKEEKEFEMSRFLNKETHIMVSTTVIEVGVNIPNATVMVIQNAEKFGLSQLHQLRGRVGRGGDKAYCFLVTSHKLTIDAKNRLKAMVNSNDGFQIAEIDLQIRGPGDILGTRQSGLLNLNLASLVKDYDLLNSARKEAKLLLANDFDFKKYNNREIRYFFSKYYQTQLKWGTVS